MLQVAGHGYAELLRTPSMRSSQNAGKANFRLFEVALLGHYPRSARHVSTGREFFHSGVHVSVCYSGWVFVGYIDEHGEEREASYRCRRCAEGK
jgi:hypothetical protein